MIAEQEKTWSIFQSSIVQKQVNLHQNQSNSMKHTLHMWSLETLLKEKI